MRYALIALQGIFIAAAIGIGIYAVATGSNLVSLADDCGFADLPEQPLAAKCGLMPKYQVQALAMVVWVLFALLLAIAAIAIRPSGGLLNKPSAPRGNWQPSGPPTGSQQVVGQQGYGPNQPPPH